MNFVRHGLLKPCVACVLEFELNCLSVFISNYTETILPISTKYALKVSCALLFWDFCMFDDVMAAMFAYNKQVALSRQQSKTDANLFF